MVPRTKCYSTADVFRMMGWEPGSVVKSADGERYLLVCLHKGYAVLESQDGEVTAIDDELEWTLISGPDLD